MQLTKLQVYQALELLRSIQQLVKSKLLSQKTIHIFYQLNAWTENRRQKKNNKEFRSLEDIITAVLFIKVRGPIRITNILDQSLPYLRSPP